MIGAGWSCLRGAVSSRWSACVEENILTRGGSGVAGGGSVSTCVSVCVYMPADLLLEADPRTATFYYYGAICHQY